MSRRQSQRRPWRFGVGDDTSRPRRRLGPRELFRRTGTRLALIQAAAVVVAFAIAGYASQIAIEHISRGEMRREVQGEMLSMRDEFRVAGAAHVPQVIAKRTRLWRGFDYGWTSADGRARAGRIAVPAAQGWSMMRTDPRDPHWSGQGAMVLTRRFPDGSTVSIGQDLGASRSEATAVARALAVAGLCGVVFCLAVSYLLSRGVWRRIDVLATSAQTVAGGRFDVRAPVRFGAGRDDVDALAGAFNTMLDRLEEAIAQVRQVSSDIAHDLRTPLTRVRQRLQRLRELDALEDLEQAVVSIEADLDAVLGMFAALLRLAEIESDSSWARAAPLDLAELAQRMADTYRPDIEASGRQLVVTTERATVRGDAALLSQAVANLLDNALRHTPASATIAVRAGLECGAPLISVADDGPGIEARLRDAALQRSRRLDAARPGSGHGLGLAIVAAIARRHRARVDMSDARPGLKVALVFAGEALATSTPGSPHA